MSRSLQLRVSLFLLPMLLKSPERPASNLRRVERWVERTVSGGMLVSREIRDLICFSVTPLIDKAGLEVGAAVEVKAAEDVVRSTVDAVTGRVVSVAATVLGKVLVGAAVVGTVVVGVLLAIVSVGCVSDKQTDSVPPATKQNVASGDLSELP